MNITLETSLDLNNEIAFETKSTTLGALLEELSANCSLEGSEYPHFLDSKRKEVNPEWMVFVNEQSYEDLSDGLNTELKDRDKVGIYVNISGG